MRIGVIGTGGIVCKRYLPGMHDPERGIVLEAVCGIEKPVGRTRC